MKKYITTPIYYVNDVPHIGHAYTTIIADMMVRLYRLQGFDTYFLTGTDEHGQKIEEAAKKRGFEPKAYTDEVSAKFKNLWDDICINYDKFIRTTDEEHKLTVQRVFSKMYEKGDIYKGEYEGYYCVSCESFFPQSQLIDGEYCPDCGKQTRILKEESYFFRLSKYEDRLLKWYEDESKCVLPKAKKNEIINFVKNGLKDLSITRTSFDWGIKLPSDLNEPNHVVYVWLDALVNYISALGYLNGEAKMEYWDDVTHIVGKDILRFHAIYWPAFLMSLDLPLPKVIAAHGWWTRDGAKMSKSVGNVVDPKDVICAYGLEQFRYFLLREVPFGQDGDFSQKALISRINGELCNDLGNLLNRIIGMSKKYSNYEIDDVDVLRFYKDEIDSANEICQNALLSIEEFAISRYLEEIWKILNLANARISKYEPWNLIKEGKIGEANALVAMVTNLLVKASILLSPIMPQTAEKIGYALNFAINTKNYKKFIEDGEISSFQAKEIPPLFTKIDSPLLDDKKEVIKQEPKVEKEDTDNTIKIDDFKNIVMKVGTILECDNIEGSDKLLKFQIDLGEEKPRQIISGIAKYYNPKDLVGKQVCVLANLKPAKIFKHLSEGMILSASDGKLTLLSPMNSVENGAVIG